MFTPILTSKEPPDSSVNYAPPFLHLSTQPEEPSYEQIV